MCSHDGYIDIALQMGLPGLIVAIICLRDRRCAITYASALQENVYLGDFFMMIVLFTRRAQTHCLELLPEARGPGLAAACARPSRPGGSLRFANSGPGPG